MDPDSLELRQLSLLRTQLKGDLSICGQTYAETLQPHEIYFLERSEVSLRSKAWSKALKEAARAKDRRGDHERFGRPTAEDGAVSGVIDPASALELLNRQRRP